MNEETKKLLAVDPAPDAETERFVGEIHRDRGGAAA